MFVTTNIRKYMSIKRKKNRLKKTQAKKSLNKPEENLWIYFLLKFIFISLVGSAAIHLSF